MSYLYRIVFIYKRVQFNHLHFELITCYSRSEDKFLSRPSPENVTSMKAILFRLYKIVVIQHRQMLNSNMLRWFQYLIDLVKFYDADPSDRAQNVPPDLNIATSSIF